MLKNPSLDLATGVITSISCGVVSLQGFLIAFIGEVFSITGPTGSYSFGIVQNLNQDSFMNLVIGALLLNPQNRLPSGSKALGLSKLARMTLGDFAIASILDALGTTTYTSTRIDAKYSWLIEGSTAASIIDRQSISEALQTGLIAIDSMIPIGRGHKVGLLIQVIKVVGLAAVISSSSKSY